MFSKLVKQKEAILAHQEGGVRRRDLCLAHKRRSIHQMDFEDELKTIISVIFYNYMILDQPYMIYGISYAAYIMAHNIMGDTTINMIIISAQKNSAQNYEEVHPYDEIAFL